MSDAVIINKVPQLRQQESKNKRICAINCIRDHNPSTANADMQSMPMNASVFINKRCAIVLLLDRLLYSICLIILLFVAHAKFAFLYVMLLKKKDTLLREQTSIWVLRSPFCSRGLDIPRSSNLLSANTTESKRNGNWSRKLAIAIVIVQPNVITYRNYCIGKIANMSKYTHTLYCLLRYRSHGSGFFVRFHVTSGLNKAKRAK